MKQKFTIFKSLTTFLIDSVQIRKKAIFYGFNIKKISNEFGPKNDKEDEQEKESMLMRWHKLVNEFGRGKKWASPICDNRLEAAQLASAIRTSQLTSIFYEFNKYLAYC